MFYCKLFSMNPAMFRRLASLFLLPAALLAGGRPAVVASFTIPADIAKSVAGDLADVSSVTPPNGDIHDMQPTPAQIRALARADLVVAIGPKFETWIADLEKSGALRRPVLWLAPELEPEEHGHDEGTPHTHAGDDPHVWMDPAFATDAGTRIASGLAAVVPGRADDLKKNAADFASRMKTLDTEIRTILAGVPADRRMIVCYHDNLSRFAKAYGFTVGGTILDGPSTEASDPSAKRLSALLRLIRAKRVPALFADNTISKELPEAVAREAGLPPPVTLYVDALDAPGTPAGTYEGMMRENARRIAGALAPAAK